VEKNTFKGAFNCVKDVRGKTKTNPETQVDGTDIELKDIR